MTNNLQNLTANTDAEYQSLISVMDAIVADIKKYNENLRTELVVLQAECVVRGVNNE